MKKKLTIGLFNDSFYPMADGVIMVLDNYARRLLKYANVIVFVPSYKNKFYDDSKFPYKVVRCKSLTIPNLEYTLSVPSFDSKFKMEFDKYKLDIVHIHSPFSIGQLGLRYAKKNNIPCVATMHSQFKQDFKKVVKNDYLATKLTDGLIKVFNGCDECWAVNSEVARIYYEEYGYRKMPKVMNNATELKPVNDVKKAINYINKKHNIDDDEKVFLFVGRINTLILVLSLLKLLKHQQ